MSPTTFIILVFSIGVVSGNNLEVYTGTVSNSWFTNLLTGNTVLDNIYTNFNTTGFLIVGAILLATSGLIALHAHVDPYEMTQKLHEIRHGPLGFVPKPKFTTRYHRPHHIISKLDENIFDDDEDEGNVIVAPARPTFEYDVLQAPKKQSGGRKPSITLSYDVHGYEPSQRVDSVGAFTTIGTQIAKPTTTPTTLRPTTRTTSPSPISISATTVPLFTAFEATYDNYVSDIPGPPYDNRRQSHPYAFSKPQQHYNHRRRPYQREREMEEEDDNDYMMNQLRNAIADLDGSRYGHTSRFDDYYDDDEEEDMEGHESTKRYQQQHQQFIPYLNKGEKSDGITFRSKPFGERRPNIYKFYR